MVTPLNDSLLSPSDWSTLFSRTPPPANHHWLAGFVGVTALVVAGHQQMGMTTRPAGGRWTQQLEQAHQVDINASDERELLRLPQVGPVLAHAIVSYRHEHGRFLTVDAIDAVPGIGPKTFDALREYITVEK